MWYRLSALQLDGNEYLPTLTSLSPFRFCIDYFFNRTSAIWSSIDRAESAQPSLLQPLNILTLYTHMQLNFSSHKSRRCHFVFPFFSLSCIRRQFTCHFLPIHNLSKLISAWMANPMLCCAINEHCQLPLNLADVMLPMGLEGCAIADRGNHICLWKSAFEIFQNDVWCSEFFSKKWNFRPIKYETFENRGDAGRANS